MFQVRATVIGYAGDERKYPCHFQHKIGDAFTYDGEKYIGRICPSFSAILIPRMMDFFAAGPRQVPTAQYYYPFWYAPISRKDEAQKKYDGIGFRNILESAVEPERHIANLKAPHAFDWPPASERIVLMDNSVVTCSDTRTSLKMKIEAFDLAELGDSTPYFRREMTILHKVQPKPGIKTTQILKEFTHDEREVVYPAMSPILVQALCEELALMGYLKMEKGRAEVTPAGEAKLKNFKKSLSKEDRGALGM